MYYRSGTGKTLTHGRSADAKFSFSRWQHSAWNDVVAAILKLWRHIKKSDSVNRYVFTWRIIILQISPDPIWNDGALGSLKMVAPSKKR